MKRAAGDEFNEPDRRRTSTACGLLNFIRRKKSAVYRGYNYTPLCVRYGRDRGITFAGEKEFSGLIIRGYVNIRIYDRSLRSNFGRVDNHLRSFRALSRERERERHGEREREK